LEVTTVEDVIVSWLRETGIVAIVRGVAAKFMPNLAEALYEGGIRLMEVTLNRDDAYESIEQLVKNFGENMSIGAGTVLNGELAQKAHQSGAQFFVTPHVPIDVLEYGRTHGLPVMAGAMTPTEIYTAYVHGATVVKVYPSATVGARYFKEVRGPLPQIPLLAVGGVTLENAGEFLKAGAVGLGLGGSLIDQDAIAQGDFHVIRQKAQAFLELYRSHTY
jgi:2-dehydro-3-deoxyphosphogluconate aldolase/(4S)-4-hydroxy-2-oxoglutarate aldolase